MFASVLRQHDPALMLQLILTCSVLMKVRAINAVVMEYMIAIFFSFFYNYARKRMELKTWVEIWEPRITFSTASSWMPFQKFLQTDIPQPYETYTCNLGVHNVLFHDLGIQRKICTTQKKIEENYFGRHLARHFFQFYSNCSSSAGMRSKPAILASTPLFS